MPGHTTRQAPRLCWMRAMACSVGHQARRRGERSCRRAHEQRARASRRRTCGLASAGSRGAGDEGEEQEPGAGEAMQRAPARRPCRWSCRKCAARGSAARLPLLRCCGCDVISLPRRCSDAGGLARRGSDVRELKRASGVRASGGRLRDTRMREGNTWLPAFNTSRPFSRLSLPRSIEREARPRPRRAPGANTHAAALGRTTHEAARSGPARLRASMLRCQ